MNAAPLLEVENLVTRYPVRRGLDPRFRVEATVGEPLLVHGIGGSQAGRRELITAQPAAPGRADGHPHDHP